MSIALHYVKRIGAEHCQTVLPRMFGLTPSSPISSYIVPLCVALSWQRIGELFAHFESETQPESVTPCFGIETGSQSSDSSPRQPSGVRCGRPLPHPFQDRLCRPPAASHQALCALPWPLESVVVERLDVRFFSSYGWGLEPAPHATYKYHGIFIINWGLFGNCKEYGCIYAKKVKLVNNTKIGWMPLRLLIAYWVSSGLLKIYLMLKLK